MRKIAFIIIIIFLFSGCAFAPLSSRMGEQTGKMYTKAYDRGMPSAEQIKKSWPFISGLVKGTYGVDFELALTVDLQRTIKALDELALKETLTDEDKGRIIGSVNRLEYLAGREFYDKYGTTILNLIKTMLL